MWLCSVCERTGQRLFTTRQLNLCETRLASLKVFLVITLSPQAASVSFFLGYFLKHTASHLLTVILSRRPGKTQNCEKDKR